MFSGCGAGNFACRRLSGGALVAAMLRGGAGGSPALARVPRKRNAASSGWRRAAACPSSEYVTELLKSCISLHAVEKLFVHNLPVGDFVNSNFFHFEPFALWLKRDVQLENHREMRTRDNRTFDSGRVNFVVSGPPFALSLHGRKPLRLTRPSRRRPSFHADDVGRVEGLRGLTELALRAQFDELVCNFVGSHDRSPIQIFRWVFPTIAQRERRQH